MSLCIEKNKCAGCGACAEVCPGGLLSAEKGFAYSLYPNDCWGCAACLKACPEQALSLSLPPVLGGRGGYLKCEYRDGALIWLYFDGSGEVREISGAGGEADY